MPSSPLADRQSSLTIASDPLVVFESSARQSGVEGDGCSGAMLRLDAALRHNCLAWHPGHSETTHFYQLKPPTAAEEMNKYG